MGILDGLAGTVANLLGTFGQTVTFVEYSEAYDPLLGQNHLTPTETIAPALVEDYPASDVKGGARSEDGVRRGDRKVTVAARHYTPTTESKVKIGGALHSIVKVDMQYGTDDALMYVLQCRR